MEHINEVSTMAKTIGDYGALIVIAASFIVLSILMWVGIFSWFRKMVDRSVNQNNKTVLSIESKTNTIEKVLVDIAESLRPTTLLQIKNISNAYFDLAIERCMRIIHKVKTENHIVDRKATKAKILKLVSNLHEDRNSKFDTLHYQGRPLSDYTNKEWIQWVAEVIEKEVYNDKVNNERTHSNIETVYAQIRLDFYKQIT